MLNTGNKSYAAQAKLASADLNSKIVLTYDTTAKKTTLRDTINAPGWLKAVFQNVGSSNDPCVVSYVQQALDKMHSDPAYTNLSGVPLAQSVMDVRLIANRAIFAMLSCATDENSQVVQKGNAGIQYAAGALHEIIATVDVETIMNGLVSMAESAVKTDVQSYADYFSDIKQTYTDINNGVAIPPATLFTRLIPPNERAAIKVAQTAINIATYFSQFYFTKCNSVVVNGNWVPGGLCAYRYGQVTVIIVPLVLTAGEWAVAKVGAMTTELGTLAGDVSNANNVVTVLNDAGTVGATTVVDNGGNIAVETGTNGDVITSITKDANGTEINGPINLTDDIQPGDLTDAAIPETATGNEIVTTAGSKGAWNKLLNEFPLKPNTTYKVDNFNYLTDGEGRVVKASTGDLKLANGNRNGYQQSIRCNKIKNGLSGDDGGHLFGTQFGGPGEQINLDPMTQNINRVNGTYYEMETEWANTLNNGGTIGDVEIEIIYGANKRPVRIEVSAEINGNPKTYIHIN